MKKKLHNKVTFKPYNPNQVMLLPPNLGSLISENHPVRVLSRIIDGIDIKSLEKSYQGGGSSSYHPRMLLKVWVYGYLKNIYSSRKIETAMQENIHFMWLAAMQRPDHNTLNDFRSKRLGTELKSIFTQVVLLLVKEGLVDIKDVYTDGTKIEANANRYTFVWAKSIARNKERIKEQLEELWLYVEQVYQKEKEDVPQKPDFEQLRPEQVEQTIDNINEALKDKAVDSKRKSKLRYGKKTWPNKLREYEEKEQKLDGRNSYSKTDEDATFMRTKDDHMKNGQLKACYNVQFSTSDKFVVNYSLGQSSSDTILYQHHMEHYYSLYGHYPDSDTADAGYGSEENYDYLEQQQVEAFVKFNYFHKEQKKSFNLNPSKKENLYYNPTQDYFVCPMGQRMDFIGTKKQKTRTGYEQTLHLYAASNCVDCPMRGVCHKGKNNRIIQFNKNLERHKAKARQNLNSEQGKKKRGQRCVDVEGTFGQVKHNKGFRRFLLRGLTKVEIELGLLAIGMNIDRAAKKTEQKNKIKGEVRSDNSQIQQNQGNRE